MQLRSKNGYNISYEEIIPENSNTIIVAMHGFSGDKQSSCISMLEKEVNKMGIGIIKFDWPAHGDSETDGFNFTVENCLNDLNSIIEYLKNKNNNYNLIAFSTSFGGYLTLLYNYYHEGVFKHLILRSPAIRMYDIVSNTLLTDELNSKLLDNGYFDYGFERNIKVTNKFIDELKNNNLIKLYGNKKLNNISIIHGTEDDVVPINDSYSFCDSHECEIYPVIGADHRYKKPGELDEVIDITLKLIKKIK